MFLQTRFSEILSDKRQSQIFVLKHVAEAFKHTVEFFKQRVLKALLKKGLVESSKRSIFYNLGRVFVLRRSSSCSTVANGLRVILSSEMANISVVDVFYYQSHYLYRKKSLCAKSKTQFQVITSVV